MREKLLFWFDVAAWALLALSAALGVVSSFLEIKFLLAIALSLMGIGLIFETLATIGIREKKESDEE